MRAAKDGCMRTCVIIVTDPSMNQRGRPRYCSSYYRITSHHKRQHQRQPEESRGDDGEVSLCAAGGQHVRGGHVHAVALRQLRHLLQEQVGKLVRVGELVHVHVDVEEDLASVAQYQHLGQHVGEDGLEAHDGLPGERHLLGGAFGEGGGGGGMKSKCVSALLFFAQQLIAPPADRPQSIQSTTINNDQPQHCDHQSQ